MSYRQAQTRLAQASAALAETSCAERRGEVGGTEVDRAFLAYRTAQAALLRAVERSPR